MKHKSLNDKTPYVLAISTIAGIPKEFIDTQLNMVFGKHWVIHKVPSGYFWGCVRSKIKHRGYKYCGISKSMEGAYSELLHTSEVKIAQLPVIFKNLLVLRIEKMNKEIEKYLLNLQEPLKDTRFWEEN